MLEPRTNPNPRLITDPPAIMRHLVRHVFDKVVNPRKLDARRRRVEAARQRAGEPHVVEYFHQLDDPYSHLSAQVLARFAERYQITLIPHLVRASGGKNQPEAEKMAAFARRDAALIAPHLGLDFPGAAPLRPAPDRLTLAARVLGGLPPEGFIGAAADVSHALWTGATPALPPAISAAEAEARLDQGSARLSELGHYSGAMFHYGGEWYWGVDRLFHLESRLRGLGACTDAALPLIAPRPEVDVAGVDASALELDFYPSLNSPYTAIIYDQTIAMAKGCGIGFNHKPVLPMIMRGVPVTRPKSMYIFYDAKREAEAMGVPFGPVVPPVGAPVRRLYSLLPWAASQGRDTALLGAALHLAFAKAVGLHRDKGLRQAAEAAGLSWAEARAHLGGEGWKPAVAQAQAEMADELQLWGVPSYRLRGGGAEDLCVWGQDRLWLVAAEIHRRSRPA